MTDILKTAVCPACGQVAIAHTRDGYVDHTTIWLADPDRTPTEILAWSGGMFGGIAAGVAEETRPIILESLNVTVALCRDAVTRRHRIGAP